MLLLLLLSSLLLLFLLLFHYSYYYYYYYSINIIIITFIIKYNYIDYFLIYPFSEECKLYLGLQIWMMMMMILIFNDLIIFEDGLGVHTDALNTPKSNDGLSWAYRAAAKIRFTYIRRPGCLHNAG